MIKANLHVWLPPALLAVLLSAVFVLPRQEQLMESSISPDLPVNYNLAGWEGKKIQESEVERTSLAADTRFSKAQYTQPRRVFWEQEKPPVEISIVYSGSDMNSSIHRPERCLPAQGHQELRASNRQLKLANGRSITFCRLQSYTLPEVKGGAPQQHIHYYVFIGHDRICHTHMGRTLYDIGDRIAKGRTQRWAYLQVGSHWGGDSGITEADAESALIELLTDLAARQINWDMIED